VTQRNDRVTTPDGRGTVIGFSMRKNTNGGPGCKQLVVRLDDGRVRHYAEGEMGLDSIQTAETSARARF
jgi:hypothetical protein